MEKTMKYSNAVSRIKCDDFCDLKTTKSHRKRNNTQILEYDNQSN